MAPQSFCQAPLVEAGLSSVSCRHQLGLPPSGLKERRQTNSTPIRRFGCTARGAQKKPRRSGAKCPLEGRACRLRRRQTHECNSTFGCTVQCVRGDPAQKKPRRSGAKFVSALCWVWQSRTNPPTPRRQRGRVPAPSLNPIPPARQTQLSQCSFLRKTHPLWLYDVGVPVPSHSRGLPLPG